MFDRAVSAIKAARARGFTVNVNATVFDGHAAEDIAKYKETYKRGFEAVRADRIKRQKELGIYTGELSAVVPAAVPSLVVAWPPVEDVAVALLVEAEPEPALVVGVPELAVSFIKVGDSRVHIPHLWVARSGTIWAWSPSMTLIIGFRDSPSD